MFIIVLKYPQGTTRLLLTLIPHFREVMISSFSCPHCNHSNSSLLNTGVIQDMGVKLALVVQTQSDLRRMIVKFVAIWLDVIYLDISLSLFGFTVLVRLFTKYSMELCIC